MIAHPREVHMIGNERSSSSIRDTSHNECKKDPRRCAFAKYCLKHHTGIIRRGLHVQKSTKTRLQNQPTLDSKDLLQLCACG